MATVMTNTEFVKKLKSAATDFKTLYVMGCFGAPMTAANKKRYTSNYDYNKRAERTAMINAASADTFGFDCVCLIKGILWGWYGDKNKVYGGASYTSNGVPDIGADSIIGVCSNVSTNFTNLIPGELVWMSGHVGIYIGDGLAVECSPAWANKVQITACNCSKTGYNRRDWKKHGKLPYIQYVEESAPPVTPVNPPASVGELKVGDIVNFKGTMHYTNSYAGAKGYSCKPGKAKVTMVNKSGARPYHLVAVAGGGSTVYGWVNTSDIEGQASAPAKWTPAVGDIVTYNGKTHYSSANSNSPKSCKGGTAKITQIYMLGKSKHPYHLIHTGSGCTVYGWVDEGTFTKA